MQRDVSTPLAMTEGVLQSPRALWIAGAVIIVLYLVTNLPWQLDDYDQAKQAYTSFEMVNEGHWFYQKTPHERVATKPPLVGWISAGFFGVTRSWDLAWRLPSLLAAGAMSILLFRAASSAYGFIPGLIALSAFGLNLLTPRLATLVRTDMVLALVIFLIGLQIWTHIREQRGWDIRDRILLFILLTAAMLIKGPIVYAFIFPGLLIFIWSRRKIRAPERSCGWWPWLASLSIFLAWLGVGILIQHNFFHRVIMREFVSEAVLSASLRKIGEPVHRAQPVFFYFTHLLHKFAPWSVLMIGLAIVDVRSRKWKLREAFRQMSPEMLWLVCWSMGGLIVMSLVPAKRVDRIFPVIPPLCLLLAAQIASGWGDEKARKRACFWSAIALALSILISSGYTFSKVMTGYRDHRDALVIFGREVRDEAERHNWRYEVIFSSDEGLLPYLRKSHFIMPGRAVTEWNRGNLDALVVPAKDAPELMRQLHDAALSQLNSTPRKEGGPNYVLITR